MGLALTADEKEANFEATMAPKTGLVKISEAVKKSKCSPKIFGGRSNSVTNDVM